MLALQLTKAVGLLPVTGAKAGMRSELIGAGIAWFLYPLVLSAVFAAWGPVESCPT